MVGMKLFIVLAASVALLLSMPSASAYLWTVSGDSPIYPATPRPHPAISPLQWGHCGDYGLNCVYYENAPFSTYGRSYRAFNYALQKPPLPGLGLYGWRWENGRYVRDVYEGYGNAGFNCRGRYC